jgi:hypothetical protein
VTPLLRTLKAHRTCPLESEPDGESSWREQGHWETHLRVCGDNAVVKEDTECDEDITNMDTPTVVAYDLKVKLFFSIIIFNIYDE